MVINHLQYLQVMGWSSKYLSIWASPDFAGSLGAIQQDLDLLGDRVNVRKHLGIPLNPRQIRWSKTRRSWIWNYEWEETHGIQVHA